MKSKFIKSILFFTIGVSSASVVSPVVLSSCGKQKHQQVVHVTSVSLDNDRLDLISGEIAQLKATVLPTDATNKNVTWTSSNESVATVDKNGNIKAISEGTATITVTTKDGGYTATCLVTVTEKVISVTSVTLDKDKLELPEGDAAQLIATVLPENATNKNVTWSSSDPSTASVDQNGNVTAIATGWFWPGTATITATTEDGGYTATCKVTVTEKIIPVTSVSLDNSRLDLIEGEAAQLIATVLPENATNKNVTWKSSTPSIATVDQRGNIKAVSEGIATITVTTEDGSKKDTCEVNVAKKVIPVTGVTLNETKLELVEGESAQLTATILPANATNKNVTWSSFGTDIATVDQNGKVTAQNLGGTRTAGTDVTVTTEDGNYKASCTVIVKPRTPVTGVTLNETKLELVEGESAQLTATILPANATNKNVTWSSFGTDIATVDQNGKVTAQNLGGTRTAGTDVTVTTEDGNYKASCTVIVKPRTPVTGITLNETRLELVDGQTTQLLATVLPENATNKNVTWKSLDTSLATVDQNGNVTAKNPGSGAVGLTTITVTTEDGGYEASCTVIVRERTPEPFVIVEDGRNYQYWGDILVKYKLLSNSYGEREALLLSKFNGDGENGYVDGTGILRIPDHVVYYDKIYYVKRIPSDWSDGSNNINGIEFASDVSHLKEICDYAFDGTDALDNYHLKTLAFPEGLEYIGTEAFYNVDRSNGNVMYGIDFPSTLISIGEKAFANAGLIGIHDNGGWNETYIPGTLTFRGNFNLGNIGDEAFSSFTGKHAVKYIYAPTIEIATNIVNHIKVHHIKDFYEKDVIDKSILLIPKVLGS